MKTTEINGLIPSGENAQEKSNMRSSSDVQQVGTLVERYRPLVFTIASRFSGVEYDDLVQEGMLGLWNAAKKFDPSQGSSFGAFAALCIQRRMLAYAASHRRRIDISFSQLDTDAEVLGESQFPQEDSSLNPLNLLILKEELAAVQRRIQDSLSPLERQVLRFYLRGDSYQEIAAELGITVKAVDNGLQRLRRKLKDS